LDKSDRKDPLGRPSVRREVKSIQHEPDYINWKNSNREFHVLIIVID
jgi:hypothetical protein